MLHISIGDVLVYLTGVICITVMVTKWASDWAAVRRRNEHNRDCYAEWKQNWADLEKLGLVTAEMRETKRREAIEWSWVLDGFAQFVTDMDQKTILVYNEQLKWAFTRS